MNPKLCGLVSCPSLKVYTCADTEKLTVREETARGKEMYQFYEGGRLLAGHRLAGGGGRARLDEPGGRRGGSCDATASLPVMRAPGF
jgi:hypothetical protein